MSSIVEPIDLKQLFIVHCVDVGCGSDDDGDVMSNKYARPQQSVRWRCVGNDLAGTGPCGSTERNNMNKLKMVRSVRDRLYGGVR